MSKRNYNPLNEGYTGVNSNKKGYSGNGTQTTAPQTLPNIQSGVGEDEKPNNTKPDDNKNNSE